jgi:hypothetical protein
MKVERGPEDLTGGRRLRAWEAVVFGEPHVESALAIHLGGGLLPLRIWYQRRQW